MTRAAGWSYHDPMSSKMLERAKASAELGLKTGQSESVKPVQSPFESLAELSGALCWRPTGVLGAERRGFLYSEFEASAEEDALVLVDFSRVDELDPAGIGLLVALQKRQRAAGGDLILFGIRPKLRRFIDSMGFGDFFSTALDQHSAVEYILGIRRDIFPLTAACPACASQLGVYGPGRSRCMACKAVLTVLPGGSVELG